MKRCVAPVLALALSLGAQRASASSFAEGTFVEGSVQLSASTRSVAMAGGESAWIAEQARSIEADLAQLRPSVRALVAGARERFEGFEPIPWRDELPSCDGASVGSPCYLEHRFESPLIPRRSAATGAVRMRIALAHAPPDAARAGIHGQLRVVAAGGAPSFEPPEGSLALPAFVFSPWPWIGLALLAISGVVLLRRRARA